MLSSQSLIGEKFGKWTLLSFKGRDKKSEQIFQCKCECGTIKDIQFSQLKFKETTQCRSCQALHLSNRVESLVGKSFGLWKVIEKIKNPNYPGYAYTCQCSCGTIKVIKGSHLTSNQTRQCISCRVVSKTSTYKIWAGIIRRCRDIKHKSYSYYGGRGIKVSERWLEFKNFLADMGIRPSNLQIDRIDNNGNYEPGNCRWVSAKINCLNKRNNKIRLEI